MTSLKPWPRALAPLFLAAFLLLPAALPAQTSAPQPQFRLALPGYHWQFPRDHFAHPDFANEWWYFTGNLTASNGRPLGFELTFFRISPFPGATLEQDLYIAHFALSDLGAGKFHYHERARRGLWRQAGFERLSNGGFVLSNENWRLVSGPAGPQSLDAAWGGMALHLQLGPSPILFNGRDGFSQKGPALGQSSYYYSLPRLPAAGRVHLNGRELPVHGLVWMDHEFATNQLAPNQQGWDWMGLQLNETTAPGRDLDLMLFQLRQKDGARDPHSSATLRLAPANSRAGTVTHLAAADFHMTPTRWWRSPDTGTRYPVAWRISIPSRQLDLQVEARQPNQELRTRATAVIYWEGAVKVQGTHAGHPVSGFGYLELTGYATPLRLAPRP